MSKQHFSRDWALNKTLNFNAPEGGEEKIPNAGCGLHSSDHASVSVPRNGHFSNPILALKLRLRQLRDGSEVLTGEGPFCNLGSLRMTETYSKTKLGLRIYFCHSITKTAADNGLWVWNREKANSLLGWMDEGFGLCVFFKLKLCSWICTKALTVKPFVMQASDRSLKKKTKERDAERAFQELHYQKK